MNHHHLVSLALQDGLSIAAILVSIIALFIAIYAARYTKKHYVLAANVHDHNLKKEQEETEARRVAEEWYFEDLMIRSEFEDRILKYAMLSGRDQHYVDFIGAQFTLDSMPINYWKNIIENAIYELEVQDFLRVLTNNDHSIIFITKQNAESYADRNLEAWIAEDTKEMESIKEQHGLCEEEVNLIESISQDKDLGIEIDIATLQKLTNTNRITDTEFIELFQAYLEKRKHIFAKCKGADARIQLVSDGQRAGGAICRLKHAEERLHAPRLS